MEKLIFFSFFILSSSFGLLPENIFLNEEVIVEKMFYDEKLRKSPPAPISPSSHFLEILDVTKQKIDPAFQVPAYLISSVKFWFDIYSTYSPEQVVIHDRDLHQIIYDALNFTGLHDSVLNRFVRYDLQEQLVQDRIKEIKLAIPFYLTNPRTNPVSAKLATDLLRFNIAVPKTQKDKRQFVNSLIERVRAQSGQRDSVYSAIERMAPFYSTLSRLFFLMEAPRELLAIPFVESSFNTSAVSRASAIGPWQFIKQTGKSFLPISEREDGRLNPILSTIAGIHLLKQNFKMFRRWEFAITAYNVGPDHIIRAKKRIPVQQQTLEHLFDKYNNPQIGFASQNYFSEFLAMAHVLFNHAIFFPDLASSIDPAMAITSLDNGPEVFAAYLSLCNFIPKKTIEIVSRQEERKLYNLANNHLFHLEQSYPRGTIFFSKTSLTDKRFLRLSDIQIKEILPLNWPKLVGKKRCVTK